MGLRILIQCFEDGHMAGVSAKQVRRQFGAFLFDMGPDIWQLSYDAESRFEIRPTFSTTDPTLVSYIILDGACTDPRFGDALLAILKLGNLVMFRPGHGPTVADEAVLAHLPAKLKAMPGKPTCVASGSDIMKLLNT